ncbi:MAG: amidohydrolase family protein [Rhizobiaceae bacterium]|nr:amidohydrolase family protein [Rhizobiaceae bacterium]
MLNLGERYGGLVHGAGCPCHTPAVLELNRRLSEGLNRRSTLKGIAASFAAAALGGGPVAAQEAGKPLLFSNVRVFDGRQGALLEGVSVLVKGNRIQALVPAADMVTDADVIDCGGRVLMPGLIDSHWHSMLAGIPELVAMTADVPYVHLVAAQQAEATLLRGFTTVRDVGGPAFSLKRAIDEGRFPGPRIFPSGAMISQTSGHGDFRFRYEVPRGSGNDISHAEAAGISAIVDGVPEVLRRVREQLMLGASQIKIMVGGGVSSAYDPIDANQFLPDEIRAAVDATTDWGTYVCAHVYTSAGINRAIDNGVKCIEHGQLADEDTVRRMADTGTWWSLQPFLADEDSNPKSDPLMRQQQEEIAVGTVRAFELCQKHKVKVAWGTDILFNPRGTSSQGRQLAKLARWFDNVEILRMATGHAGDLLALSGERSPYRGKLGVIEAGAFADMIVVDGDPLKNIELVSDPEANFRMIVRDGRIHKDTLRG